MPFFWIQFLRVNLLCCKAIRKEVGISNYTRSDFGRFFFFFLNLRFRGNNGNSFWDNCSLVSFPKNWTLCFFCCCCLFLFAFLSSAMGKKKWEHLTMGFITCQLTVLELLMFNQSVYTNEWSLASVKVSMGCQY